VGRAYERLHVDLEDLGGFYARPHCLPGCGAYVQTSGRRMLRPWCAAHISKFLCQEVQLKQRQAAVVGWLRSSRLQAAREHVFQPPKLELADRIGVADHLCVVLKAGQSFMRDLGRAHEEHVIVFAWRPCSTCGAECRLRLLSCCLTDWALSAKACDELKLRSFGPHVSVSFVSLLSTWPSVWQHTLGHLTSSCGPNTGAQ
jgi:hypothetical protein